MEEQKQTQLPTNKELFKKRQSVVAINSPFFGKGNSFLKNLKHKPTMAFNKPETKENMLFLEGDLS